MATRANRGRLRLVETQPAPSHPIANPDGPQAVPASDPGRSSQPSPELFASPRPRIPSEPSLNALSAAAATRAQLAALSDAQLVALGCRGEIQALELLYRRHAAFAIQLATRIEGTSRDVEDIAHDAFLRAFERLDDLTDRSAFRSWLGSIVVHATRSRMRHQKVLSALGLGKAAEPVDLDAIASPDASPHVRAQIAQIYALIRTLPTDEQIAWVLRHVEGHELEVTARMTRCSLATVKRRLAHVQSFLDAHFVDPEPDDVEDPRSSPSFQDAWGDAPGSPDARAPSAKDSQS
jgi:RNA polymerase sigma-70 factor, ECF subfamily